MKFLSQEFIEPRDYKKLLVFDRDRTLIEDAGLGDHTNSPILLKTTIGVLSSVDLTNVCCAIATNQRGLSIGRTTLTDYEKFNNQLVAKLKSNNIDISSIVTCPHSLESNCSCRKPKPGLLLGLQDRMQISPADVLFVGDSISDNDAAKNAGIPFLYVQDDALESKIWEWLTSDNC